VCAGVTVACSPSGTLGGARDASAVARPSDGAARGDATGDEDATIGRPDVPDATRAPDVTDARDARGARDAADDAGSRTPTECDDGIDNDEDGFIDWGRDLGCYGPTDTSEASRARAEESGFTTFDVGPDSRVVYVSTEGDDALDGSSPSAAVRTLTRGAELVRDGEPDFLLLRRGDTWRDESLGRFGSGRDADHPVVIAPYGEAAERPRIELDGFLLDHNGARRNFVALVGVHVVVYPLDPDDPEFTGAASGGIRYVGGGSGLLIEGCRFEYGSIVVQSYGEAGPYEDVEIRRNVVDKAYHRDTCTPGNPHGNVQHRVSGMYASGVNRLTLEGNLFDNNGWNEDVDTACATIFNHNLYLNANGLVVRDNLLSRASSIHLKLRSDSTGDMKNILVENNYFTEGEIGISIGGNSSQPFRFVSATIRRNVMSGIGRTRPTTRTLAWGMEVRDNDELVIEENHFLNQHEEGVGNSYALQIAADTERDLTVTDNLFYRIQSRALRVEAGSGHENVRVTDNTFVDPDQGACLIEHSGSFEAYTYADNRYSASAPSGAWFCVGGDRKSLAEWKSTSGERSAASYEASFNEPSRTVESYARTLGLASSLEAFLDAAREQERSTWRADLTAPAVNDYIRAGFDD